jgi:hypothetical protein
VSFAAFSCECKVFENNGGVSAASQEGGMQLVEMVLVVRDASPVGLAGLGVRAAKPSVVWFSWRDEMRSWLPDCDSCLNDQRKFGNWLPVFAGQGTSTMEFLGCRGVMVRERQTLTGLHMALCRGHIVSCVPTQGGSLKCQR